MNKVIVITGGTSGIGKYVATKMAKDKNNKVFILGRNEQTGKELEKENLIFIKCDLLKEKDISNAFKSIAKKVDKIDLLINNAADDHMDYIKDYEYDTFVKIINTNLVGKVFCIKNSIDLLKKSEYPSIINIASRLATIPMMKSSAYCTASAGIIMLTKCSAIELEEYNIRVNAISPSLTLTPLSIKSYTKDEIENTSKKSTRNRLCTEEDIYELILFLSSKKSDYINGENIQLSGGILLK